MTHGRGSTLLLALTSLSLSACDCGPRIPEPDGPFGVGTIAVELVDETREDRLSEDPQDRRRLMVQLWYPTEEKGAERSHEYPTHDAKLALGIALAGGEREFAQPDAPLLEGNAPFPVVLFSHGLGSGRFGYTYLVESLASHGSVVAGIDHTHYASQVEFSDGTKVSFEEERRDIAWERFDDVVRFISVDQGFVADELVRQRAPGLERFVGRLDEERFGVLGHSLGGAAAIESARRHTRFRAALNMDGRSGAEVMEAGAPRPVLFLDAAIASACGDDEACRERRQEQLDIRRHIMERTAANGAAAYRVEVEGVKHADFSDTPAYAPISQWAGMSGELPPERVMEINKAYVRAFLERHLEGAEGGLLSADSADFPEVTLTVVTR